MRPPHLHALLDKQVDDSGGSHISVDSSAPTILRPGFESQAHNLRFYSLILYFICHCIEKWTKINKKRPG